MRDLEELADRLEIEGISDQEFVGFSECDLGGVSTSDIYTMNRPRFCAASIRVAVLG